MKINTVKQATVECSVNYEEQWREKERERVRERERASHR